MTEKSINIILLGCSTVGKTNLINTSVGLSFNPNSKQTVSSKETNIIIDKKNYLIQLYDTLGPKSFRNDARKYIQISDIIIFVYDITSLYSFKELDFFINMANEVKKDNYIGGIIGNKIDLFLEEQVSEDDAHKYADSKNFKLKFTSAKFDGLNFKDFLVELIRDYISTKKKKTKNENLKENKLKKKYKRNNT